eukprot:SAG22_NODE_380_length_11402_cov_8.514154_4_plen_165_part_00
MTGRYAFRWGATAYTIVSEEPWGIPLDEQFLPEYLEGSGHTTAVFGKVSCDARLRHPPTLTTFHPGRRLLDRVHWKPACRWQWHMGLFKEAYLPYSRGFQHSAGMLSGASDHYTHQVEGAYDWHRQVGTGELDTAVRAAGTAGRHCVFFFRSPASSAGCVLAAL